MATIPISEMTKERLAELMVRAHGILGFRAPGPQDAAMAFDNWLESYKSPHPGGMLAMIVENDHRPAAKCDGSMGSSAYCWDWDGSEFRFGCVLTPYGSTQYMIPRDAEPVPDIPMPGDGDRPAALQFNRFIIMGAKVAMRGTQSETDFREDALSRARGMITLLEMGTTINRASIQTGGVQEVAFARSQPSKEQELMIQPFIDKLLQSQPNTMFRVGPLAMPLSLTLAIPSGTSTEALSEALGAMIFMTGYRPGEDVEATRSATKYEILKSLPALVTAMVTLPKTEAEIEDLLGFTDTLGASLMFEKLKNPGASARPATPAAAKIETVSDIPAAPKKKSGCGLMLVALIAVAAAVALAGPLLAMR